MSEDVTFSVVLTTAGSRAQAVEIAGALVERRLAACVNIVEQACSIYWWQGAVQREAEHLLLVKIRTERFDDVRTAIRALHSYDTPEVVRLDVADGDPEYLAWLARETADED